MIDEISGREGRKFLLLFDSDASSDTIKKEKIEKKKKKR